VTHTPRHRLQAPGDLVGGLGLIALGLGALACDGTATPSEIARTTRIVSGVVELVGDGPSSCSHQPVDSGGSAERWCAFAGPHERGQPAQLWVVNVDRARRGEAPCDGTSPNCLRLTSTLWTGEPLFGSHPGVHGFYGDTLFFYTDSPGDEIDAPFAGTVQAWRPGMTQGRAVSGANGFYCFGHQRAAAAVCLSNQSNATGALEFDLLAGPVIGGPVGPLPMLEHVRPYESDGSLSWGVSFSPTGEYFAFSTRVPEAAATGPAMQRLRIVRTAELGVTPPTEILRDLHRWSFTPDGRKLLFLRGVTQTPEGPVGNLTMADFPTGENVVSLAPGVDRYEAFGEVGHPLLGIGFFQNTQDLLGTFRIMRDVTRPAELVTVATGVDSVSVSPDLRYTHFQDHTPDDTPFSQLARNDGTSRCQLNQNPGQSALSVRFAKRQRRVFWTEDVPLGPGDPIPTAGSTIQGWFADPETCGQATRFSSALGYFEPTAGGLLWGEPDTAFTSMKVRYAPFKDAGLDLQNVTNITAEASFTSGVIDERYYFFTVRSAESTAPGLYVHGPLR
jgi:hypothetical protein